jgi:hypothetical protein
MYRLLSASKDTYITNKIIEGAESTFANVGQAGTLDLFKLFGESYLSGTQNPVEVSRILIGFDYSDLNAAIVSKPSFTASLVLKDVYGGQTVPSNFQLVLYPLSKSFDEGRGMDVFSFKDLDTANFFTASLGITWGQSGATGIGNLGDPNIDIISSGNIGYGLQGLSSLKNFARGDEDALFNVTSLVSASVAGLLPNHGFRISFTEGQETDSITRFVKRFGSRHTYNTNLRPKLIVEYDDRIMDTSGHPYFGVSQSFFTYNVVDGSYQNFSSGGLDVTAMMLTLAASKSISYVTSSWQPNFSASINHVTTSVVYYSQSFSASLVSGMPGTYQCDFTLDQTTDSSLNSFLSGALKYPFKGTWKSLDGTTLYSMAFYEFNASQGGSSNSPVSNYVVNAVNLLEEYRRNMEARIRVFAQNRDASQEALRYASITKSTIIPDMRWRLIKAFDKTSVVVPFAESTRMSTDGIGMYFDLPISDLELNEVYELEFLIKNSTAKDVLIQNKGFVFKVIP